MMVVDGGSSAPLHSPVPGVPLPVGGKGLHPWGLTLAPLPVLHVQ